MLRKKSLFSVEVKPLFHGNNFFIHFKAKNIFFLGIFGGWSIKYDDVLCANHEQNLWK